MMPKDRQQLPDWRAAYYALQKLKTRRCLEPNETCEESAIRAHSIQNSRILDALCHNGHVIMPRQHSRFGGVPTVSLKPIGRNEATTFTGLCANHDRSIFEPIDRNTSGLTDPLALFLLAYRSVLRETHACIEASLRLQAAYQQRVADGRSPSHEPDSAGMHATAWLCNSYDCYLYKRTFDRAYLRTMLGEIIHEQLPFEHCRPSIAVSSLFSLDDMPCPDDVGRIVLNIFPIDAGTRVIFSFLERDADVVSVYLHRVLSASGEYQKYLVSKLVLQHCDNLVISPLFFDHLSDTAKEKISAFFSSTIFQNRHEHEDSDLYLFW